MLSSGQSAARESDPNVTRLPTATPGVAVLVERARDGDTWASEMLYRQFVEDVTRVATFILGRSDEVEDVVHDAFVRAFDHLDQLEAPSAFGGWLARIAVNGARNRLRKRRWLRTVWLDREGEDVTFDRIAARDASPEQRTELALIGEALRKLSPDARTAWVLRRVEGWTLPEISEALKVSLATTKRRIDEAETVLSRFLDRGATR